MASELDQKFDATLAAVIGPGGRLIIGEDEQGRAIVANFPATLPSLLRTFCALNAQTEALVSDDERFTFADLDQWSERLGAGARRARDQEGRSPVAIAMRNCPSWIIAYMAALKAGAVATLINGWWQSDELKHALEMTDPALIIADPPREATDRGGRDPGAAGRDRRRPADRERRWRRCWTALPRESFRRSIPKTTRRSSSPPARPANRRGALSTHRAVTTGVYAYATGLIVLKAILESEGRPPEPPRTLLSVPLFHVTGEVPVLLNSFVIGRGMVLMRKWDAGEALR
jgi:long-chain acyl-CoA synthetase